ncbi:MAG TPA: hypothetical protein PLP34_02565 [Chitinophagaceae bacterium]|nr:hypothetical protein [Chitinophagaceae bacterium]HNF71266.1 hypothetical protein [Chitinophagaceae bacterium]
MRNVIHALQRNRRILERLLGKRKKRIVHKDSLCLEGFLFRYHTHSLSHTSGIPEFFCFDYGYRELKPDYVLIMKRNGGR